MFPTPLPFQRFKKLLNQSNVYLIQGLGWQGRGIVWYLRKRLYQVMIALYIAGIYIKEACSKTDYIRIFSKIVLFP